MYSTTYDGHFVLCREYYSKYEQKMDIECELGWNWAAAKGLNRGTEFICDWEKVVKKKREKERMEKENNGVSYVENMHWNGQFFSMMQIWKKLLC
jgi:hypothetical protein